jgi:parallel beta-helix repeat protein
MPCISCSKAARRRPGRMWPATAALLAGLLGTACGGGTGSGGPEAPPGETAVEAAPVDEVDTTAGDPIDVAVEPSGEAAPSEGAPAPADTTDPAAGSAAEDTGDRAYALGSTPSSCEKVPPSVTITAQRRVTDFGAVRDDGRDDSAAIQRALDAMNAGEMLVFPTGRYHISKSVHVRKPGITIRGETGAIIHATNPDSMAILIEQDRTTVQSLTFTAITDRRRTAAWHARIAVAGGNPDGTWRWVYDTVIRDNKILPSGEPGTPGANSASNVGILMVHADRFLIANNTVSRTRADGIHVTNGSRNGRILNNTVRETGDDMIAVVSYIDSGNAALNKASNVLGDWLTRLDQRVNKNILVAGNRVGGQYWGRGITVVGGRKVTIARNIIDNVPIAAGVLLAREANYQTFGTRNVLVEYNTIRNVQNMAPTYDGLGRYSTAQRTGHGAIEIHASQFQDETANTMLREELTVADVMIRANTIERANASAVRMGVGGSKTLSATDSGGRTVTRSFTSAALPSPSIQVGRFNAVSREPVSVQSDDLQARGVHCSGNLRDGSTYQPSVCRTAAPAVTGATLVCSTEGRLQY